MEKNAAINDKSNEKLLEAYVASNERYLKLMDDERDRKNEVMDKERDRKNGEMDKERDRKNEEMDLARDRKNEALMEQYFSKLEKETLPAIVAVAVNKALDDRAQKSHSK